MSNNQQPTEAQKRTFAHAQREYSQLAMKAGEMQYKAYALTRDVETINKRMVELSIEGAQLKAAEDEIAAAVAKAKQESEVPVEAPKLEGVN